MNKVTVSTAIGIACLAAGARSATLPFWPPSQVGPIGPVTIKMTILAQDMARKMISSKTLTNSTSTNIIQVLKSTVTNTTFGNIELLQHLENSFQTNFPSDAKLASDGAHFFVMDGTGTNVILDASDILHFYGILGATAGLQSITTTHDRPGLHYSGNDTEVTTGQERPGLQRPLCYQQHCASMSSCQASW